MAKHHAGGKRKHKRPRPSEEEIIAALVASRAYEARQDRREDAKRRRLLEAMRLDAGFAPSSVASLSRWELAELAKVNERRAVPLLNLPDAAYEARRLRGYLPHED